MSRFVLGLHPVREALRAGRPIDKIMVAKGVSNPRIQEIIDLCKSLHVPVRFEAKEALDRVAKGVPHQNVVAFSSAQTYIDLSSLVPQAQMLVALDGIEDPHNLGAIVRSAHAAGADAIIVTDRRSAPLTETVGRVAAGALEHIPVARVTNLTQALERLKRAGYWIYGLDERGPEPYDQIAYTAPTVLVFGSEGKGLHANVQKHCDVLVSIPMAGAVSSLNVSVAAGVVLFEWRRRLSAAKSDTV